MPRLGRCSALALEQHGPEPLQQTLVEDHDRTVAGPLVQNVGNHSAQVPGHSDLIEERRLPALPYESDDSLQQRAKFGVGQLWKKNKESADLSSNQPTVCPRQFRLFDNTAALP